MIIYLNKNCNGFKWYAIENLDSEEDVIEMTKPTNKDYPTLGKLMLYADYEYILLKENGAYILSIDNIPESYNDSFGRSLSMKIIFIDNSYDSIMKILLAYIGYKDDFEKRMASFFYREKTAVSCELKKLKDCLSSIYEVNYIEGSFSHYKNSKLMLIQTWNTAEIITKHFGFDYSNVKKVLEICKDNRMGLKRIENPFKSLTHNDSDNKVSKEPKKSENNGFPTELNDIISSFKNEYNKVLSTMKEKLHENEQQTAAIKQQVETNEKRMLFLLGFCIILALLIFILFIKN